MGRLLELAKAVLAETRIPSGGQRETGPVTPSRAATASDQRTKPEWARPRAQLIHAFEGSVASVDRPQTETEFPKRRCRACNSWLFWVSVYGAVMCSTCHPPASPDLLKSLYWLPEGEGKRIQ
jgi:hypothetical protein